MHFNLPALCSRLNRYVYDVFPPEIQARPAFREAARFKKDIEPVEGVEYDWVWEHARDSYERVCAIGKDLDDKANDPIKYLGGGVGLFALAVLANVGPQNAGVLVWAFPSFLAAIASIFFAVLARKPSETFLPPGVSSAIKYADYFGEPQKAKGAFLGLWHLATEGVDEANKTKAVRVQGATWFFFAAIVLLSLPIVAAIDRASYAVTPGRLGS